MTVQRPRRRSPATVAARPATSLETALTQVLPERVALAGHLVDTLADTLAAAADKNATSAARSAISLVTAPKAADLTAEVTEATKGVTAAVTAVDVKAVRHATPAADMDTCRGTARKDRSATTVGLDSCHQYRNH